MSTKSLSPSKTHSPSLSRKGARRISEIPPEVLEKLNRGEDETVNLVEWLAVDFGTLIRNAFPVVGLADQVERVEDVALSLQSEGVVKRIEGVSEELFRVLCSHPERASIEEKLATHRSDLIRAWVAFTLRYDPNLSLSERFEKMRPFADDPNMSVREEAWLALRPLIGKELEQCFQIVHPWTLEVSPNLRRFAIEATRPCGVWCKHIPELKTRPERGEALLENVRSDPSRYVQTSVANWINDASKSAPDWTIQICSRWEQESPTAETRWTVKHALRTLRKQGKA